MIQEADDAVTAGDQVTGREHGLGATVTSVLAATTVHRYRSARLERLYSKCAGDGPEGRCGATTAGISVARSISPRPLLFKSGDLDKRKATMSGQRSSQAQSTIRLFHNRYRKLRNFRLEDRPPPTSERHTRG
jgi:hypothetical protein